MAKKEPTIIIDDQTTIPIAMSVRDLVEFLVRGGDIDNRSGHKDPEAMLEGARLHRKIQKRKGSHYTPEVSLSHTSIVNYGAHTFSFTIDGRADGIMNLTNQEIRLQEDNAALVFSDVPYAIDEIKCVLRDISSLTEPAPVHLAQAKCYAHFYALQQGLSSIAVQLTYCHMETERIRYFTEFYTAEELASWYYELCLSYCKWAEWQYEHACARDASTQGLDFPFPYRPGQKSLVTDVYRTILRRKKLFIEAPTGVGKTISTVYPAILSMGQKLTEKLFYLTAKTITRTVAEEAFRTLIERGLVFLPITITAKEKVCVLEKPDCNPVTCPRARGHFDRVNDAVFALLSTLVESTNSSTSHGGRLFDRELLLRYAEEYQVCPYEMSLDVALFADAVICDYNYVFDPNVYFRRFFANEQKHEYIFLIDEAHNLVDRAREMYSATLTKEDFLACKRLLKGHDKATKALEASNRALLTLRQQHEHFAVLEDADVFVLTLLRTLSALEDLLADRHVELPEEALTLYLDIRHFLAMHDLRDENYTIYCDYSEAGHFFLRLQCMNPAPSLRRRLESGRSGIFFSATLLPIRYYMEQLGGTEEDYAVYAPSPFSPEKRCILLAKDVSTRYTRRTDSEYRKIAEYIRTFCSGQKGNYLAFFPSYQFLSAIAEHLKEEPGFRLLVQTSKMTETEREEFLLTFAEEGADTLLGLCVMGGIFSEGIDLRGERLIGAIIVGTGLPMVCNERELFRDYYEERNHQGFAYAYQYPGMNKVLQSAGRVIRTTEDIGAILLLDERFHSPAYRSMFPREWNPIIPVTRDTLSDTLTRFWNRHEASEPDASHK